MATTKIWDVSAHVSKLLAYVANKNKTTMELENKNVDEAEQLAAEILGLPTEHFAMEEKKFVTGINCTPDNANEVMMTLLEDTDKDDIQAYHGYQSFIFVRWWQKKSCKSLYGALRCSFSNTKRYSSICIPKSII